MGTIQFQDQVIIVTGGSQGIGRAIAKRFAELGGTIVIADIAFEQAQVTANELSAYGAPCMAVQTDVSSEDSRGQLVQTVVERYGKIDILINNAGIASSTDVLDLKEAAYDRLMSINLKSTIFLSQLVMQHMIEQKKSGSILNLASIAGQRGALFAGIDYASSKGGILAATKCLALKGGAYGIRVNAVAPGMIKTPMSDKLGHTADGILLQRLGTAEEVADAVAFLSSDMASYITGFTLDVNGGCYLH